MRKWLKTLRHNKSMTQSQVAENAGISRAYYSEIENNIKNPSVETAKRIADILNFNWTFFFTEICCEVKHDQLSHSTKA